MAECCLRASAPGAPERSAAHEGVAGCCEVAVEGGEAFSDQLDFGLVSEKIVVCRGSDTISNAVLMFSLQERRIPGGGSVTEEAS